MKINFRKTIGNKQVDSGKIETFVRSRYYPEDMSKDKGKKANFRKSSKKLLMDI